MFLCQNGFSWQQAWDLDPLVRGAVVSAIILNKGGSLEEDEEGG